MRTAAYMIAAGLLLATPAHAGTSQKKVEVEGVTYRVLLKNSGVHVFNKSVFVSVTPVDLERRKRAVKIATGCELTNAVVIDLNFAGTLDCPAGAEPMSK